MNWCNRSRRGRFSAGDRHLPSASSAFLGSGGTVGGLLPVFVSLPVKDRGCERSGSAIYSATRTPNRLSGWTIRTAARTESATSPVCSSFHQKLYAEVVLNGDLVPNRRAGCMFAQTTMTRVSAELTTIIASCQFGGRPVCSKCGCIASAGSGWQVSSQFPLLFGRIHRVFPWVRVQG